MWSKYQIYRDESPRNRSLIREALLLLMRFRAATLLLKFKYLTRSLIHSAQSEEPPHLNDQSLTKAKEIGDVVARVGRHTPWKSPCLAQVLAVQHMLAARGIPGVFYLGVKKDKNHQSNTSELDAHAWLKCGTRIVNGAEGHEAFTVVSSWSWS